MIRFYAPNNFKGYARGIKKIYFVPPVLLLLNFRCVTHFNALLVVEHFASVLSFAFDLKACVSGVLKFQNFCCHLKTAASKTFVV